MMQLKLACALLLLMEVSGLKHWMAGDENKSDHCAKNNPRHKELECLAPSGEKRFKFFGPKRHYCRKCGESVCENCSDKTTVRCAQGRTRWCKTCMDEFRNKHNTEPICSCPACSSVPGSFGDNLRKEEAQRKAQKQRRIEEEQRRRKMEEEERKSREQRERVARRVAFDSFRRTDCYSGITYKRRHSLLSRCQDKPLLDKNLPYWHCFKDGEKIKLGEGNFGIVWKAEGTDEKFYAVKQIQRSKMEENKGYISKELKIQQKLSEGEGSDYFLRIQDYVLKGKDGNAFLVLPYMPRGDLSDCLRNGNLRGLPVESAKLCFRYFLECVAHAHDPEINVILRDIKPANMLVSENGQLFMGDFGISKVLDQGDKTNTICGTTTYMAPEIQASYPNGYDHAVDLWSLGVILYQLLTRKVPFLDENPDVQFRKMMALDYNRDLIKDKEQRNLVEALLKLDPEERLGYKNMDDLLNHPAVMKKDKFLEYKTGKNKQGEDVSLPRDLQICFGMCDPDELPSHLADLDFSEF